MASKEDAWSKIEDPARRCEIYLRAIEFHIPKVQLMTLDLKDISLEEIIAELARREAEESEGRQLAGVFAAQTRARGIGFVS